MNLDILDILDAYGFDNVKNIAFTKQIPNPRLHNLQAQVIYLGRDEFMLGILNDSEILHREQVHTTNIREAIEKLLNQYAL